MKPVIPKWTPTQLSAIHEINQNQLILSGPGTGKTSIIAGKVAYLIDQGYQPCEILITTFTNKATDELKQRITQYCQPYNIQPHHLEVYTVHSLCRKIIHENLYHLDPWIDVSMIDEIDQKFLILSHHQDLNIPEGSFDSLQSLHENIFKLLSFFDSLNEYMIDKKDLFNYISGFSYDAKTINRTVDKGIYLSDKDIYNIFLNYRKFMWDKKLLDHSQALKLAYTLVKNYGQVKQSIHNTYRYILVDEYQDISQLQHELFRELYSDDIKICAVGDDDQGIYQFRGANISNLLNFPKDFPNVKISQMGENYRSTQEIVRFSNSIWSGSENRFGKDLSSMRGNGSQVYLIHGDTAEESARQTCKIIKELKENEIISDYSDVALLFRSVRWHFIGWGYKNVFDQFGIPCIIHRSGNFFDHPDIFLLVEWMIFFVDKKISKDRLERLLDLSGISNDTKFQFLSEASYIIKIEDLSPHSLDNKYNVQNEMDFHLLSKLFQLSYDIGNEQEHEILQFIYQLLSLLRYFDRTLKNNDIYSLKQVSYLTHLAKSHTQWGNRSFKSFVEHLMIFRKKMTLEEVPHDEQRDGVHVSTIHNVKGLQYKVVFVCEFDPENYWNGTFEIPKELLNHNHSKSDVFENQLRLFYVALTRAEDLLFINISNKTKSGKEFKRGKYMNNLIDKAPLHPYSLNSISNTNQFNNQNILKPGITLSYSSLKTYLLCPLRYQLEYDLQFRTSQSIQVILGEITHKVLEKIHFLKMKSIKVDEETISNFLSYQINKYDHLIQYKNQCYNILETYYTNYFLKLSEIIAVEMDFEIQLGLHRFAGCIDLITKTSDGQLEITDFKTGNINPDDKNQLISYAYAFQKETFQPINKIKIHYLQYNKVLEYFSHDKSLEQIENTITEVSEKVYQKIFPAQPEIKTCSQCSFSIGCTYSKAIH